MKADTAHTLRPPIATIYQNSDQVAGILQQIVRQPLLTEESREMNTFVVDDTNATGKATGAAEARARMPILGNASARGEVTAGLSSSWTQSSGTASRQQFVYSQAYNLHLVREYLQAGGHLTQMASMEDAAALAPGAFVEFTTTFDPVELTLALDVISPQLVEAVTRFQVRQSYKDQFPTDGGHEARVRHAERMRMEEETKGSLARAITDAVRADARQETTREYYARVAGAPPLTAITICDLAHFIVDDPDRLLDGTFTVLGKVISAVEHDVPTFARNKLLRNLAPSALDVGVAKLEEMLQHAPEMGGVSASTYIDLKLSSRVDGASVRVMPLAIFS
ncbi:hypothetical protein ACIPVB_02360 [Microbacterium sp. NPDC090007]|uniref:DUF6414 family protein n=1 Tax=Microbacterium sp. NPDC090007 TaxID=3364204 RepID=UPI0038136757